MDANLWGFFAVPVGVLILFGPVLLVWFKMERADEKADKDKQS